MTDDRIVRTIMAGYQPQWYYMPPAPGQDIPAIISRWTARALEQNLARLGQKRTSGLFRQMNDAELSGFLTTYTQGAMMAGHRTRLYDLLSVWTDTATLARVAVLGDQNAVYEAVATHAPNKLSALHHLALPTKGGSEVTNGIPPQLLDMTLPQLWNHIRTQPFGRLSALATVYQMASIVSGPWARLMGWSTAGGYFLGQMWSTYAPQSYETFGGTLHQMVDNLSSAADLVDRAAAQVLTMGTWGLSWLQPSFTMTGGDSQSVWELRENSGYSPPPSGGGCGTANLDCPKLL